MTILSSDKDRFRMRESGKVVKRIFEFLSDKVVPGATTGELDRLVEKFIRAQGAEPAFKGYKGYPAVICASKNEIVVHGIPSDKVILEEGDIIGIDVGVKKHGFFTDAARTYAVGKISAEAARLIEATKKALDEGIKEALAGNRVFDISNVIQKIAARYGYQEVRVFVGHGVGKDLHEPPEIPNWGEKGKGALLKDGQVLAIEPMINLGTRDIEVLSDGWTAATKDKSLSAHFENTVIVGHGNAEVIT